MIAVQMRSTVTDSQCAERSSGRKGLMLLRDENRRPAAYSKIRRTSPILLAPSSAGCFAANCSGRISVRDVRRLCLSAPSPIFGFILVMFGSVQWPTLPYGRDVPGSGVMYVRLARSKKRNGRHIRAAYDATEASQVLRASDTRGGNIPGEPDQATPNGARGHGYQTH